MDRRRPRAGRRAWPACGTAPSATAGPRSPTRWRPRLRTLEAYSCFEPFTNEPADELAGALADDGTDPDARVFLCCSGSEAVDTAMKLARLAHGWPATPSARSIISRDRGYHGANLGGTSAQGIAAEPRRMGSARA